MHKNQLIHNFSLAKYFVNETNKISKYYISILLLASLFKAITPFIIIIMPKYIIDELLGLKRIDVLVKLVIFTVSLNFIFFIINNYFNKVLEVLNEKINISFQNKVGKKAMEMNFKNTEDPEILRLKESAVFSITIQNSIVQMILLFTEIITNVFIIIGMIALVSTLNILIVLLILIIVVINSLNYKKSQEVQYNSNQEIIEINRQFGYFSRITLDFSMAKDIRLFNMKQFLMGKIKSANSSMYIKISKMFKKIYNISAKNIINIEVQNLITYIFLIYMTFQNRIGIGSFTMYLSATQNLSNSISQTINSLIMLNQNFRYLGEYKKFDELTINNRNSSNIVLNEINDIEFRNVSFKYPKKETFALKNINIRISKGQKLSIVGMNGAGKTTFIKLLSRLYEPTEGLILINGIDIKEYSYDSYIENLSVIFQDFKMFAFSLRENISFDEVNSDKIELILDKINLAKDIANLNKGLDTSVYKYFDENGIEFSGGQAQKIAIGRALYKSGSLLILDEPTAALDPRSEDEIYNNFYQIAEKKTTIFISHRLSSCKICDRIAVFKEGEIIQYGNHRELYDEKGSLYEQMYSLQANNYSY